MDYGGLEMTVTELQDLLALVVLENPDAAGYRVALARDEGGNGYLPAECIETGKYYNTEFYQPEDGETADTLVIWPRGWKHDELD